MKDQVTSIEQSRRLLELGVPAEKASMVWTSCSNEWHLSVLPHYRASKECIDSGVSTPAFTVVDLLEIMPKFVWSDEKGWCRLIIRYANDEKPVIGYDGHSGNLAYWRGEDSVLDNMVHAIIWLMANGFGLEL